MQVMGRGDLETARAEAKEITGEAATILAPWLAEMEAKFQTEEVLRRLLLHHLSENPM